MHAFYRAEFLIKYLADLTDRAGNFRQVESCTVDNNHGTVEWDLY
jgi:hypothetical protein